MAAIFFDIDGTLWDKQNVIPDSTKEAIRLLKAGGHRVFICSGRTRAFIYKRELLDLEFDGILSGCGTLVEYHGEALHYKQLEPETLERSVKIFHKYKMPMIMEGRHALYVDRDDIGESVYRQFLTETAEGTLLSLRENRENWEASKFSVLIGGTDFEKAMEELGGMYEFLNHDNVVMETVPKGYSKASGIRFICEYLGIPIEDTYAFGDSANDLEMLDVVGTGICMGDGKDIAKQHADYVTDGLHEDGIFNACLHFSLF